jgi:DNA-binding NtrC family response regulator
MARILIVDDDEIFGKVLEQTLRRQGYELVRAHNGKEALRHYNSRTIDLVITDLIMPDFEGIELIMELQRQDPGIKIIAMSGGGRSTLNDYLPIARRLGAIQTLAKPFSNEELMAAINATLGPAER